MIHFVPQQQFTGMPANCDEALSRLAGIRNALRLVEPGCREAWQDAAENQRFNDLWDRASEATRRCFETSSERTIDEATAGLEAMLAGKSRGDSVNPVAVKRVAGRLREGLDELERVLVRT